MASATQNNNSSGAHHIPAPPAPPILKKEKRGRKPGSPNKKTLVSNNDGILTLRLPLSIIEEIRNHQPQNYVEQLVINDFFRQGLLVVKPKQP